LVLKGDVRETKGIRVDEFVAVELHGSPLISKTLELWGRPVDGHERLSSIMHMLEMRRKKERLDEKRKRDIRLT
jgi:hypothetical protein